MTVPSREKGEAKDQVPRTCPAAEYPADFNKAAVKCGIGVN